MGLGIILAPEGFEERFWGSGDSLCKLLYAVTTPSP